MMHDSKLMTIRVVSNSFVNCVNYREVLPNSVTEWAFASFIYRLSVTYAVKLGMSRKNLEGRYPKGEGNV